VPVGSISGFSNSDLLVPDPTENGPDPQACPDLKMALHIPGRYYKSLKETHIKIIISYIGRYW